MVWVFPLILPLLLLRLEEEVVVVVVVVVVVGRGQAIPDKLRPMPLPIHT